MQTTRTMKLSLFGLSFAMGLALLSTVVLIRPVHNPDRDETWRPQSPISFSHSFPYRPVSYEGQEELVLLAEEALDSGHRIAVMFVFFEHYWEEPHIYSDIEDTPVASWDAVHKEKDWITGIIFACVFSDGFSFREGESIVSVKFSDLGHDVVFIDSLKFGANLTFLGKGFGVI